MQYLYHAVPREMLGNTLYPLNELKEKYPDLYRYQMEKYSGREHILQQKIPKWNCLWNDVLHLTAVAPNDIKRALIGAGDSPDTERCYYQIDPTVLTPQKTVVYLNKPLGRERKMTQENFTEYDPNDIARFSILPHATKEYFQEKIEAGERPLLYHQIPHILYKGSLDVSNTPTLCV